MLEEGWVSMLADADPTARRLEAEIVRRARDFTLPALLRALRAAGYGDSQIALRSHPSLGFAASLVESVEFVTEPERHAVVTVNHGLLSNQGPLPAYFWELLADQRESLMYQFFWFFDDRLLAQECLAREPERDPFVIQHLPQVLGDLLRLLRLSSPHGLHWLFQAVFPEVEVHIRRAPATRTLEVTRTRVGHSELSAGSALLGFAQIPAGGLIVTLFTDESHTAQGQLWGTQAEERLRRHILPRLRGTDLLLTVILAVRDHYEHLELSDSHHLAYGVLYSEAPPREARPVHYIVLYSSAVDAAKEAARP
jgi:hypothetical protein